MAQLGQRAVAPAMLSVLVAEFARAAFAEIDGANRAALGHTIPVRILVDGRDATLESVNARHGVIEFEWQTLDDPLTWIWQALKDHSPVRSGRYRNSHQLMADGNEVAPGGVIPQATQYVFVNEQPYAHKIEIGTTESGRAFVIQVPNRIYERVAKDAGARFETVANISFAEIDRKPSIIVKSPNNTFASAAQLSSGISQPVQDFF
jgi:hypothetical protein